MFSDLAVKTAFLISLLGHCLFFRIPLETAHLSKEKRIPEEISLNLEIEVPALLPKIDLLGDEKRFKLEESSQVNKVEEPKEKSAETIEEAFRDELFPEQEIKETSYSEPFKPGPKVNQPAEEEMLRYQDMVKQRIEERRIYPAWARKQRIEGMVLVSFIILANGQAQEINIIRSSGSSILDQEASNTIKMASPFAPIPEGTGAYFIQMDVSLVFTLG